MALLWQVTDRDIDRWCLRLYADWFSGRKNSSSEVGPNLGKYIISSETGEIQKQLTPTLSEGIREPLLL